MDAAHGSTGNNANAAANQSAARPKASAAKEGSSREKEWSTNAQRHHGEAAERKACGKSRR